MEGKTVLITGATSGIGEQTALALASQGHTVYLLVRNVKKGNELVSRIITETQNTNIEVIECDLTNLKNVSTAASQIRNKINSIDVLINNAGGVFADREVSIDGFEMTFALNHLGHFLLTLNLMPLLIAGKGRVINIGSEAHRSAKVNFKDLQSEHHYSSIRAYGNAKLFNIYFARSIAERYGNVGVTAYSLHPGVVNSAFGAGSKGLFRFLLRVARPFMISPEKGAETSVYLATEPGIEKLSGRYFKNKKEAAAHGALSNNKARQKLWVKSEELTRQYLL